MKKNLDDSSLYELAYTLRITEQRLEVLNMLPELHKGKILELMRKRDKLKELLTKFNS